MTGASVGTQVSPPRAGMHVLLLSQFFPPEVGAGGIRFAEMIPEWEHRGHRVTVIAPVPNYPDGVVQPEYRGRFRVVDPVFAESEAHRVWVYPAHSGRFWARVLNFVSFMVTGFLNAVRVRDVDVIVATTPPLSVAVLGRVVSLLRRRPLVLDVRDLWPETASSVGVMRGPTLRFFEGVERHLYRAVERIVVVSPAFVAHVEERVRGENPPDYIPNGVVLADDRRDGAHLSASVKERLGLDATTPLLVYVGTHGLSQNLLGFLDVANELEERGIHLLFVGDGAQKGAMEDRVRSEGMTNVHMWGIQPRERVRHIYRGADAALVVLRDAPAFEKVIPSKLLEIMAEETPVLLVGGHQAAEILSRAGAGMAVRPGAVEDFVRAADALLQDRSGLDQLGRRGRAYVAEHHRRSKLGQDYADVLEEVWNP